MENGKRIIVGQLFLPNDVQASILARLCQGPEVRESFYLNESGRMIPELRNFLYDAIQNLFGDTVEDVMLVFSRKAGCQMCPCSPGFHVSVMMEHTHEYPSPAPDTLLSTINLFQDKRERLHFYVQEDGGVKVTASRGFKKNRVFEDVAYILPSGYEAKTGDERHQAIKESIPKGTQLALFAA